MKYLTTISLLLTALLTCAQNSFIHLESQNLPKKTTEYFGSLADKSSTNKTDETQLINFNPSLYFNGVDDYLTVKEDIPDARQMTIFTVFVPAENTTETFDIWNIQSENSSLSMTNILAENSSSQLNYDGIEKGKPNIHTYMQYYRPGAQDYTDGETYITWGTIDQQDNPLFTGAIAELKMYNKILSVNHRNKIISSLAIKYGISLKKEQNYVASNDQIVWDAMNNKDYSYNITGIGREDAMKLYQKQSTSSNNPNFLTIGVEAIQSSNEANEGIIQDEYFMIWGDNNLPIESSSASAGIEATNGNIQRKWLMNVTGNAADNIQTQVKLDASTMLKDDITSYLLIIDETGTGTFSNESTRFLYPTAISEEGIITYDKVQWDEDGSGKDVFSFKIDDRQNLPALNEDWINDANSLIDQFIVYPNLSIDGNYKIYVQLEKIKDISIQVFDMAGKMVTKSDFKNQHAYFIEGIPVETAGLYTVTLQADDEIISRKLVVEN